MKVWQRGAIWLFIGGALLLVLVLIPGVGKSVNGSKRWLSLVIVNVQPSEFMKLAVVLRGQLRGAQGRLPACRATAAADALARLRAAVRGDGADRRLAAARADFGAFVVILAIAFGILFISGLDWRLFLGLVLLAALAAILIAAPYRVQRLTNFMDPWADPLHKGYQLSHSLIAFGRGEWLGVGLGSSVEKLLYLPEAQFPARRHRGGARIRRCRGGYALFAWLLFRGYAIGRQAARLSRPFAALVAHGIGVWIGVQAFINMGVNMGVLPTKGLTLPLLSFGGSGIVVNCIAVAVLLRIDFENRRLLRGFAE